MNRSHCLKILSLALVMGGAVGLVGAAVAADISVTSTFTSAGPNPNPPPTCDATAGAGQGGYSTPDGQHRSWSSANSYCTSQGMRLPTKDELVALYNANPNNTIATTCGWPTDFSYWSSTQSSSGYHYDVQLVNGFVYGRYDSSLSNVTCVR